MKKKIIIVDYGLGNIRSAEQSLNRVTEEFNLNAEVKITNDAKEINSATHIVLPGQGAFLSCINGLINIPGMIEELSESVLIKKKPFLGICVGMQLLANISYEHGEHLGLGWIEGEIKMLPKNNIKLPHMGWNEILIKTNQNELIKDEIEYNYYFVHSYFFECQSEENEVAVTDYGFNFSSIISKENIFGVQFHPEKSSLYGLKLLNNFINL